MANKITGLINDKLRQDYATMSGTAMHARMQHIFFDKTGCATGDADIADRIAQNKELVEYMGPLSRTEVPIAGYLDGRFLSRRIDRLYINHDTKTIVVIDYKTDIDKERFYQKYIEQLAEYRRLLADVYPGYSVACKILWTNDFTLENVI